MFGANEWAAIMKFYETRPKHILSEIAAHRWQFVHYGATHNER